ncbi:MAG: hypothetical protein Q9N26_06845, partial [Aquificota bacterium]|nr:hypothetical protein [Aquificota bacterium]
GLLRGEVSFDVGEVSLLIGSSYLSEGVKGLDLTLKHFLGPYRTLEIEGEIVDWQGPGFYLQASIPILRRWGLSLRYGNDRGSSRFSSGFWFHPTEFSRIRLAYNHGDVEGRPVREVILQGTFSIGPHRAHPF